ncbi:MAG: hypothetical protein MUE44_07170 [Oscillatoriaceae cyanobacterium Prado104]|nr:hypothetical protein [Oscillatoriaceae cyanobacterium Prado104]
MTTVLSSTIDDRLSVEAEKKILPRLIVPQAVKSRGRLETASQFLLLIAPAI